MFSKKKKDYHFAHFLKVSKMKIERVYEKKIEIYLLKITLGCPYKMEVRSFPSEHYQDIYESTMTKISQGVSQTPNNSKVSSEEFLQILSYLNDQLNQPILKNNLNCFIGVGNCLLYTSDAADE